MTVVVLTPEQLQDLVERAITRALARAPGEPVGDVLTTEQAAELAGVTPKTVRTWIAEGLPARRHRRRLVIRRADLDAWRSGQAPEAATILGSLTGGRQ